MSSSREFLEQTRRWARQLTEMEAERSGVSLALARATVARRAGVPESTLITLAVGRLKTVAAHVYERIRAALIAQLKSELGRLEHELNTLRATGLDTHQDQVAEVEKFISAARRALGKEG